jgi:hypothetical protein
VLDARDIFEHHREFRSCSLGERGPWKGNEEARNGDKRRLARYPFKSRLTSPQLTTFHQAAR